MLSLAQESARELFLLHLGVRSPQDVIAWADSAIEKENKPPAALIELSTAPIDRIDYFLESLSCLKEGDDGWPAVREALADVHDFVKARPNVAESIAGNLWPASSFVGSELPPDLRFFTRFEDSFCLAREQHYGTVDQILADFLAALSLFKQEPNQPSQPTSLTRRG
jgi:hypothetical protein